MFTIKSKSAAHAFIDIVRCAVGNPHLVDVVELSSPTPPGDTKALARHVDRTLEAAEVIAAACLDEPRKGMVVPIDVRDPAILAALSAMVDLYAQFLALDDAPGYGADATDVSEIRMTIQAALDLRDAELPETTA